MYHMLCICSYDGVGGVVGFDVTTIVVNGDAVGIYMLGDICDTAYIYT